MRAHKVDANQAEIFKAARACGMTVLDLSGVGKGAPDACFGFGGHSVLVEIKDGRLPPSKRKLTPYQVRWRATWDGDVFTVACVEDVLRMRDRLMDLAGALRLCE